MQGTNNKEFVRLVFFGSPLLDITVRCGLELLDRYDLPPDGCTVATDQHDGLFDQLLRDPQSRKNAGGSALNSAKIAKWALDAKGRVSFAGCVGEDEYASLLSQELRSCGVEPLFVSEGGVPTGTCACLLSCGGEHRSLCTRRGAAALFRKEHLRPFQEEIFAADALLVVGYLLPHSYDAVEELAEQRRPHQIFALSLSAEYVCREFRDAILRVLPRVDVLLGNEREFMALAEGLCTEYTVEKVASFFAGWKGHRTVVITRGPEPLILAKGGGEAPLFFPVPSMNKPVLDSVGCGDALAGAFLAVFVLSHDPVRAVREGIVVAAEIARTAGCQPPTKPLMELLEERINKVDSESGHP